jgi:alkylhydroperoxidase/carboxymuconolactone decarboxylase family protein YurZ
MADNTQERADTIVTTMKEDRGYTRRGWEFIAEADPAFLEAYNGVYRAALMDGQALPAKYRELIALGILAFRNRGEGVRDHIKRAIRLGATQREILDAIETIIVPGGAPTMHCALQGLSEALDEIEAEAK